MAALTRSGMLATPSWRPAPSVAYPAANGATWTTTLFTGSSISPAPSSAAMMAWANIGAAYCLNVTRMMAGIGSWWGGSHGCPSTFAAMDSSAPTEPRTPPPLAARAA